MPDKHPDKNSPPSSDTPTPSSDTRQNDSEPSIDGARYPVRFPDSGNQAGLPSSSLHRNQDLGGIILKRNPSFTESLVKKGILKLE